MPQLLRMDQPVVFAMSTVRDLAAYPRATEGEGRHPMTTRKLAAGWECGSGAWLLCAICRRPASYAYGRFADGTFRGACDSPACVEAMGVFAAEPDEAALAARHTAIVGKMFDGSSGPTTEEVRELESIREKLNAFEAARVFPAPEPTPGTVGDDALALAPPWVLFSDKGKPCAILPAGRPGEVADVTGISVEAAGRIIAAANAAHDPWKALQRLEREVESATQLAARDAELSALKVALDEAAGFATQLAHDWKGCALGKDADEWLTRYEKLKGT